MMQNRPKIGIALGSGVARGWAHIGVLQALEEAGIEIDAISGTSIGALVGGVYLANHLDTLEAWARSLNRMRMIRMLDFSLSGGLINGNRLARVLRANVKSQTIETLPKPFIPVCTEMDTGHEIWIRDGDLVDALRASYAIPGVFPPVDAYGFFLVDGALVNPVPTSVCRAMGSRLVIAVDLNADLIGRSKQEMFTATSAANSTATMPFIEPARTAASQLFSNLIGKDAATPKVFDVIANALNILQDRVTRSRLAGDPPDVVIAPRIGHIGLMEFDRADEAIEAGREAVERALPEIQTAKDVLGI